MLRVMSLNSIIRGLQKEIEEKEKAQEDAFSVSRKVITLAKQAVMAIHREESDMANEKLKEAQKMLGQLNILLLTHRDLTLNIARVAYQEYAEAEIFFTLVNRDKFPKPSELEISTISYLLGLADSIGEFRRRALEFLRRKKLKLAEHCLQIMNEIYSELLTVEEAYSLAPELRHKCDIARHLIETTVGDIATETGRSELERSIKQLEKRIRSSE